MKKSAAYILVLCLAWVLLACIPFKNFQYTTQPESQPTTKPTTTQDVVDELIKENPIWVELGDTITIDGIQYQASTIYDRFSQSDSALDLNTHVGTFYVNRVTRDVYTYIDGIVLPTGWKYDGEIQCGTIVIPNN